MKLLEPYILELIFGGGITTLAFMVRAWTSTITKTNEKILARIDDLVGKFHEHTLEDATALARIDAELRSLKK